LLTKTEPHVTFREIPTINVVQADTQTSEESVEEHTPRRKGLIRRLSSASLKTLSRTKSAPSENITPIPELIPQHLVEKSMLQQMNKLTLQPKAETPQLIIIVQDENLEALHEIIDTGLSAVEINAKDELDNTALMWAVYKQSIYMANTLLMQPYIDLNCQNKFGYTALHQAVILKDVDMVKLLLSNPNLHVNKQDQEGHSVLHYAILLYLENPEDSNVLTIINMLLQDPRVSTCYYENNKKQYMHNLIPKNLLTGNLHYEIFSRFMIERLVDDVIKKCISSKRSLCDFETDMILITQDDFDVEMVEEVKEKITQAQYNFPEYARGNLMHDFITKMVIAQLNGLK
jgi:hypothetical protein